MLLLSSGQLYAMGFWGNIFVNAAKTASQMPPVVPGLATAVGSTALSTLASSNKDDNHYHYNSSDIDMVEGRYNSSNDTKEEKREEYKPEVSSTVEFIGHSSEDLITICQINESEESKPAKESLFQKMSRKLGRFMNPDLSTESTCTSYNNSPIPIIKEAFNAYGNNSSHIDRSSSGRFGLRRDSFGDIDDPDNIISMIHLGYRQSTIETELYPKDSPNNCVMDGYYDYEKSKKLDGQALMDGNSSLRQEAEDIVSEISSMPSPNKKGFEVKKMAATVIKNGAKGAAYTAAGATAVYFVKNGVEKTKDDIYTRLYNSNSLCEKNYVENIKKGNGVSPERAKQLNEEYEKSRFERLTQRAMELDMDTLIELASTEYGETIYRDELHRRLAQQQNQN